MIRKIFVAAVCVTVWSLATDQGLAQRNGQEYLFAQYYTPAGTSTANAEMYPAPHPVPAHVGNSYYTYQPLMPHEMMYTHSRNYYNYYASPASFYCDMCRGHHYKPGYGFNKTTVRWQSGTNSIAPLPGNMFPFSKLNYLWHKHHHAGPQPGNCVGQRVMRCLASHCSKCRGGCGAGGCDTGCDVGGCDVDGCDSGNCGDSCWSDDSYPGGYEGCDGGCDGGCASSSSSWTKSLQQAIARATGNSNQRYSR